MASTLKRAVSTITNWLYAVIFNQNNRTELIGMWEWMLVSFGVRVKKNDSKMGGIDPEHRVKYAASCLGSTSKKLKPKLQVYMRK